MWSEVYCSVAAAQLGLEALALAQLVRAQASEKYRPGCSTGLGLGYSLAWPGPRLPTVILTDTKMLIRFYNIYIQ